MRKYFIPKRDSDYGYAMSSDLDIEATLTRAKEQERKYDWLEAAKSYEQALRSKSMTTSSVAETWQRVGFCYSRASRQVESLEEFKRLRQLAVEAYIHAAKLFEKEDGLKNEGRSAECNAIARYVGSWLASSSSEKRKMLDECRIFGNKSLEAYKNAGDELSYGKMCNDLLVCLLEKLYVASDWREMGNIAQEGIDCADKAIAVLSKLGNKSELIRAYFTASLQSWYAYGCMQERKELMQRSLSYSEKALALSKEVDDLYYAAMSNWAAAFSSLLFTENTESALEYAKEMLQQGTIVKDNYLKGVASYVLTFVVDWMILKQEDPDKKKEGHEEIIKHAEDAIRHLQSVSQDYFIAETCLFYAETYSSLAREVVTSLEEKRPILEKAVEIGRKGLEHATRSGSPDATGSTHHALSKALHFYSNLETRKDEKTRLLEEALVHRKEYNKIVEKVFPSNDWIRGVGKNYEGIIKSDLARLETDKDKKIALLESAVSDMKDGVSRCKESLSSNPVPARIAAAGEFEDWFGGILDELYLITEDREILNRAIEVYDDAAEKFKKVNLPSRVAESYWRMARNQDRLGEHQKASEMFENAFREYQDTAQKNPDFVDFYLDYAAYMKAWSEIEKAKFAHEHEEYATAMKHYEETASLLKQSKLWSYLSSNFAAWTYLEHAEDLSRKERITESMEAFKKSAEAFKEAQEAIEEETDKITLLDEKNKAIELSKASLRRKDYCLARSEVERARMYDLKGDHEKSAETFDSAANKLEKILETSEAETDRKEMEPVVHMCRGWQKMKMADGRDLPELYREASELFLKAKEHSTKDRTSLFASGNSALCKALEFGTRFEATRDKDDFSRTKQFLVSASNFYLKAGFGNASLWTRATEVLFDAYNFMGSAEVEVDPEKRMKTYLLAEKCLERSARLYEKAGFIGKRDEVLNTLKKVEAKREFALSLRELLAAPMEASNTGMMSTLGLSVEEPVGFSKFQDAFIESNLIVDKKQIVIGESFTCEVHLANLGKSTAFLTRVEHAVPEECDLIEKPEKCILDDGSLNLRGRKMAALETGQIKLVVKPRKKGKFIFKPKIRYTNEAGEIKSCDVEQVTITVMELGIRGWLRGPG